MATATLSFDQLITEACAASTAGWDFSFLHDRTETGQLPWDYQQNAITMLDQAHRALDVDTGGDVTAILVVEHLWPGTRHRSLLGSLGTEPTGVSVVLWLSIEKVLRLGPAVRKGIDVYLSLPLIRAACNISSRISRRPDL